MRRQVQVEMKMSLVPVLGLKKEEEEEVVVVVVADCKRK